MARFNRNSTSLVLVGSSQNAMPSILRILVGLGSVGLGSVGLGFVE